MITNDKPNIGRNLWVMGVVVMVLGIILSIVVAIALFNTWGNMGIMDQIYGYDTPYLIGGWVSLILGPFFSVLFGMLIRGFGRLIENSEPKTIESLTTPKEALK